MPRVVPSTRSWFGVNTFAPAAWAGGRAGHRRLARHRRAIADQLARAGAMVIGTATSDAGAQAHIRALSRTRRARPWRHLRRARRCGEPRRWSRRSSRSTGSSRSSSTTPASRATSCAMRMKDDDWEAVIDTNLSSVFRLARAVMRGDDESQARPHHQHHFGGRCQRATPGSRTTPPRKPASWD